MTETIGARLTQLISPIVAFYLSEAETESYPYATYDQTVMERHTKDEVYMIESETVIRVYGKNYDTVNGKALAIKEALKEGLAGPQYIGRLTASRKTCTDGVWEIELNYTIKQTS